MAIDRKNEKIAEIIRQKDVIMKMLRERMIASNVILQEHELKYKVEKAWREVKKAGINPSAIIPGTGMVERQIAEP